MSKFLHNDVPKATALARVFSENSQAKKKLPFNDAQN